MHQPQNLSEYMMMPIPIVNNEESTTAPSNQFRNIQMSFYINESIDFFYDVSKWLNVILITLVSFFGLYGNLISIFIFRDSSYNKNSIKSLCVYLILLASSDLLVLIFHYLDFTFRTWANLTDTHAATFIFVDKSIVACKLVPYLRNVFRTVSVYALVLMTLQRFILIYFPSLQARLSSVAFSTCVAITLVLLSFLFNLSTIFVNELETHSYTGLTFCSIAPHYQALQFRFDLVFVVFTILLPAVIIICLGVVLHRKIRVRYKQFKMCAAAAAAAAAVASGGGSPSIGGGNANGGGVIDGDEEISEHVKQRLHQAELIEEEKLDRSKKLTDYLNYVNTKFPQMPNMENLKTIDVKSVSTLLINEKERRSSNRSSILQHQHQRLHNQRQSSHTTTHQPSIQLERNRSNSATLGRKSMAMRSMSSHEMSLRRNLKQSIKTTYMLLIVSKWFLLLHLPYFVCWCIYYLHLDSMNRAQASGALIDNWDVNKKVLLKSFLQLFEVLFLFNYAINFMLYMLYGPAFRKTHSRIVFKIIQSSFYYVSFCFYHCAK